MTVIYVAASQHCRRRREAPLGDAILVVQGLYAKDRWRSVVSIIPAEPSRRLFPRATRNTMSPRDPAVPFSIYYCNGIYCCADILGM